jgi:hypothetical protein
MKLLRADENRFAFHVGQQEKALLLETLRLYPLIPAAYPRFCKTAKGEPDENQHLLEEALAAQRAENRNAILTMLKEPARFRRTGHGFHFTLTAAELERLLQVFNDIRVGSWIALGSPEEGEEPAMIEENAGYFLALEVCGHIETVLLAATGEHGPDPVENA